MLFNYLLIVACIIIFVFIFEFFTIYFYNNLY